MVARGLATHIHMWARHMNLMAGLDELEAPAVPIRSMGRNCVNNGTSAWMARARPI